MDWHNCQCALIKKKGAYKKAQRRRQLEHQLKSSLVYSKLLCVRNAFLLCWNEITVNCPQCSLKTSHFKSLNGRKRSRNGPSKLKNLRSKRQY